METLENKMEMQKDPQKHAELTRLSPIDVARAALFECSK